MRRAKEDIVTFRLSTGQKAALKLKAAQLDFPGGISQLMRAVAEGVIRHGAKFLNGGGGVIAPVDRKAVEQTAHQIRLAGNLLNQLLRNLHLVSRGGGQPVSEAEVRRVLQQLGDAGDTARRLLESGGSER